MWRRPAAESTHDDVVEVLRGLGTMLMSIDAKLEEMTRLLEDDEDES